jgi:hypothetical protein
MKKIVVLLLFTLLLIFAFSVVTAQATSERNACWGQASAVYAQLGEMGTHSSEMPTPRDGLRNLARLLYADGAGPLTDDTMQALGAYVAAELGLSIDACM